MIAAAKNDVNPDMFGQLRVSSEFQASQKVVGAEASFVQKCIHPPSCIPNYHGLPTNDARSQVTAEYRGIRLNKGFEYQAGGFGSDPKPLAWTSKIAILSPNSARTVAYQFIWDTDANIWRQDVNNVYINGSYDFQRWQYDARLYRPAYKSITTYLNATYFNNTGMVVGNQFNPAILFSGTLSQFIYSNPVEAMSFVRQHYKSLPRLRSNKMGSPLLPSAWCADYDAIYQHKIGPDESLSDSGSIRQLRLDPATNIQVVNMGSVPSAGNGLPVPTPDEVLQNSMRSAGYRAMDGTFSVQRLNTIAPSWMSASNIRQTEPEPPTTTYGLYQCYMYWIDAGGSHFVPFVELDANHKITPNLDTQWTKDMTWSWTVYEGLTGNSTILNPNASEFEILLIKFYLGLEIQPTFASAWSGMVELAPAPDLSAMQLLQEMNYELKDVLPCKYNAGGLGDILKMAFSALTGGESEILTSAANIVGELGKKVVGHFMKPKANNNNVQQKAAASTTNQQGAQPSTQHPKGNKNKGAKKNPPQVQNKPGTGKRAMKRARAKARAEEKLANTAVEHKTA